jgi:hypothetical protein
MTTGLFPKAAYHGPVPGCYGPGSMETPILGLVLHIMQSSDNGTLTPGHAVDTIAGCDAWFHDPASQVSAHFGTGTNSGELYQWVPVDQGAWAEVAGNNRWVSIENSGLSGDHLLPSQIESCAQVLAWLHTNYGVPLQSTDDVNVGGVGWHGMGGAAWGDHLDCPGQPVIDQRSEIIARAKEIVGAPTEGDDMPTYVKGQSGPEVKSLQGALRSIGWGADVLDFKENGIYDAATVETVLRFCQGHGIAGDDGSRFGPECWAKLFPKRS